MTVARSPIREDEPLESVLGNEALRRLGALIATDAEGQIRGVLTIDAIGKASGRRPRAAPTRVSRPDLRRARTDRSL